MFCLELSSVVNTSVLIIDLGAQRKSRGALLATTTLSSVSVKLRVVADLMFS